ncbi:MAG TPA: DUF4249 domain-containing protein [Cyclobacteriaceae bacterium]|nr:DUF4249 domain-containing protein [Cyclobacteriaceae bacterium]
MRIVYIIVFFSALILWSCDKAVVLDLDQMPPKVVIEGLVSNQPGYQFVKVSRTVDFYESGATPRVSDAIVFVSDDLGNEYSFVHNPNNHADSTGYYLPTVPFVGEPERSYHLSVTVEGELYEAEDKMYRITEIDSLQYQVNEEEQEDPKEEGKFYELLLYAKEPQETTDYYLFKFFRNDSLKIYSPTDIYFADDKVLGEEINGVPSPVFYAPDDSARVEMYSLSRVGYVFYSDLFNLLNNDGGMFSPPPANSRTNLTNGALGFFQVSAITISGIRIKEN